MSTPVPKFPIWLWALIIVGAAEGLDAMGVMENPLKNIVKKDDKK